MLFQHCGTTLHSCQGSLALHVLVCGGCDRLSRVVPGLAHVRVARGLRRDLDS
jgi:hypothetical protein